MSQGCLHLLYGDSPGGQGWRQCIVNDKAGTASKEDFLKEDVPKGEVLEEDVLKEMF